MNASLHRDAAPVDLSALVDAELSTTARLGQLALVLVLIATTGTIGVLGLTRPSLPFVARLSFVAILVLGLSGSVFALWTLSRRTLLVRHRVIGCRVAVALSAVVVLAASAVGLATGVRAAFAVAGFGVILFLGTIALLRQARERLATLTARREALARLLNTAG